MISFQLLSIKLFCLSYTFRILPYPADHSVPNMRRYFKNTHIPVSVQERTRLTSEMEGLRRRLQEAEHCWMECKEDCIRLTERLNNAEREVGSIKCSSESTSSASRWHIFAV